MPELDSYKIPVIPGINDNPLPPNFQQNQRGPNGSYFIEKYNDLIEALKLFQSTPGEQGEQGPPGADGQDGADGSNGRGILSESYDPQTGVLTLEFTDGSIYETGDLRGAPGLPGSPATISIGTVSVVTEGEEPFVENVGTETNVILDFGLPPGIEGPAGPPGGGSGGEAIPVHFEPPSSPPTFIGELYLEIRYSSPNRAILWVGVDPDGNINSSETYAGWAAGDQMFGFASWG